MPGHIKECDYLTPKATISRRRVLGGFAAAGMSAVSGCVTTSSTFSSGQSLRIEYLDDCAKDIGIDFNYDIPYGTNKPIGAPNSHAGIDLNGDLVLAAAPGEVVSTTSGYTKVGGNKVSIRHYLVIEDASKKAGLKNYNVIINYNHIKNFLVNDGDWVYGGQPIALPKGNTDHTHFEVKFPGEFNDKLITKYRNGSLQNSELRIPFSTTSDYWMYETFPVNPHLFWFDGIGEIATFEPERHKWFDKPFAYPDHVTPLKLAFPVIRQSCNSELMDYLRNRYPYI